MATETSIYEYARQGSQTIPGNKVAFWFYGKSLTYQAFWRLTDNMADRLAQLGVGVGKVVTIHLPNSPQAAITFYATAKLGAVCNMVHPQVPFQALKENMRFSQSEVLVIGDHFEQSDLLADLGHTVIYVRLSDFMSPAYKMGYRLKNRNRKPEGAKDFKTMIRSCSVPAEIPLQKDLSDACVAYLHSSGTTSLPKTVMHRHSSFNNWVDNSIEYFKGEDISKDIVLAVFPFFHSSGLLIDLHRVLSCGGTLVLIAKWNPKQAVKFIKKYQISLLTGVPAIFKGLLDQQKFSGAALSSISKCFISGDRVSEEIKKRFDERLGKRILFECYGMTEIATACFVVSENHYKVNASGYPLVNCHVAVLDSEGIPHHHGEGELLVSTNTMMMGYLNDPEATEKVWVEFDNRRWIRTGDIGEVDADGFVFFKERLKHVIVKNGYDIFPGEIESVIRKISGVNDVCVMGILDEVTGSDRIWAFVEPVQGADEQKIKSAIKANCKENLPTFSLPQEIRIVSALPRNRMKKIDRRSINKSLTN